MVLMDGICKPWCRQVWWNGMSVWWWTHGVLYTDVCVERNLILTPFPNSNPSTSNPNASNQALRISQDHWQILVLKSLWGLPLFKLGFLVPFHQQQGIVSSKSNYFIEARVSLAYGPRYSRTLTLTLTFNPNINSNPNWRTSWGIDPRPAPDH